jgi:chromate transporter
MTGGEPTPAGSTNRQIKAFVDGVTAAATGAIAGAAFVLGRRAVVDVPTLLILAGTYLVLGKAKQVPEPLVILAAGVIGFTVSQSR